MKVYSKVVRGCSQAPHCSLYTSSLILRSGSFCALAKTATHAFDQRMFPRIFIKFYCDEKYWIVRGLVYVCFYLRMVQITSQNFRMTVKSCDILSWISLWASETLCNVIYNMIYFEGVQNSIQEIGNWSDRLGPVLIIPLRVVNICIIGIIFGTM